MKFLSVGLTIVTLGLAFPSTNSETYPGSNISEDGAIEIEIENEIQTESYVLACAGAIDLADSSVVVGDSTAAGAFTIGANVQMHGNVEAVGAVTVGASAQVLESNILSHAALSVGVGAMVENLWSGAAVTLGADVSVAGTVTHIEAAAFTVGAGTKVTQNILISQEEANKVMNAPSVVGEIKKSLPGIVEQARKWEGVQPFPDFPTNNVLTLSPGTYNVPSAMSLSTAQTIEFKGASTDSWRIHVAGAATFAGSMTWAPEVRAANIHWVVEGAVTVAAGVGIQGSVVATGAVSVGADARMTGDVYSQGACTVAAGAHILISKKGTQAPTKAPTLPPTVRLQECFPRQFVKSFITNGSQDFKDKVNNLFSGSYKEYTESIAKYTADFGDDNQKDCDRVKETLLPICQKYARFTNELFKDKCRYTRSIWDHTRVEEGIEIQKVSSVCKIGYQFEKQINPYYVQKPGGERANVLTVCKEAQLNILQIP
jgi:predicted acyltransferase (DUF342 family)